MLRSSLGLLALSLLALIVPSLGCGSSDGSPPSTSTRLQVTTFQSAATVIGQLDFAGQTINMGGGTAPNTLDQPEGTGASDGTVGYVPDTGSNRVLGFMPLPVGAGLPGNFVLGQPNFAANGSGTTQLLMNEPVAAAVGDGRLAVADTYNHRVLVWNSLPTSIGTLPDVVVGQPDFVTSASVLNASGLSKPAGVVLVAGRLIVADTTHNRVLVWNTVPTMNGQPADLVVGQPDFGTATPLTANARLDGPRGVWSDGMRLVVADRNNDRVMIWSAFPTANGQPADLVLGQPDFATTGAAAGAQGLDAPAGVWGFGDQLLVADTGNHRVLVYEPFPTTTQAAAVAVLGQADFAHNDANDDDQDGASDAAPTARTLSRPEAVTVAGTRVIVTDRDNNRVLFYDAP